MSGPGSLLLVLSPSSGSTCWRGNQQLPMQHQVPILTFEKGRKETVLLILTLEYTLLFHLHSTPHVPYLYPFFSFLPFFWNIIFDFFGAQGYKIKKKIQNVLSFFPILPFLHEFRNLKCPFFHEFWNRTCKKGTWGAYLYNVDFRHVSN